MLHKAAAVSTASTTSKTKSTSDAATAKKIVATGTFAPNALGVSGAVTMTMNGNRVSVNLVDYDGPSLAGPEWNLELAGDTLTPKSTCDPATHATQDIDVESTGASSLSAEVIDDQGLGDDPTYIKSAIVATEKGDGCPLTIGAVALLTWHLPNPERSLQIVDSGARDHAEGVTTVSSTGEPEHYTVATGDTTYSICARFGITQSQLGYLNPLSQWASDPRVNAGTEINLNPNNR